MKKIFTLLMLFAFSAIIFTPNTYAQGYSNEKITVNANDLTVDQLAKIKAQQEVDALQKKLDTYGNWVGVGGEIGTAVKEGLTAVVDVADKFGKTDVGRFTMLMVAYKVIGRDLVKVVLGLLFIIITTWFIWFSFKRTCLPQKILIKDNGFMKYPKEYQIIEPKFGNGEGLGAIRMAHLVAFFLTIWITYSIMF